MNYYYEQMVLAAPGLVKDYGVANTRIHTWTLFPNGKRDGECVILVKSMDHFVAYSAVDVLGTKEKGRHVEITGVYQEWDNNISLNDAISWIKSNNCT